MFELTKNYDLVYKWPGEEYDLNKLAGNGKRLIAYDIVKRISDSKQNAILHQLKEGL